MASHSPRGQGDFPHMRLLYSAFTALLVVATAADGEFYEYHPSSPLKIGGGFNRLTPSRAYPPCLDLSQGFDPLGGAAKVEFATSMVKSQEDLFSMLKIDANLSARYTFASASASFSMEREVTFHSDDL